LSYLWSLPANGLPLCCQRCGLCPCNCQLFLLSDELTIEVHGFSLPRLLYLLFPLLHFPPQSRVGIQQLVGPTTPLQLIFDLNQCLYHPPVFTFNQSNCNPLPTLIPAKPYHHPPTLLVPPPPSLSAPRCPGIFPGEPGRVSGFLFSLCGSVPGFFILVRWRRVVSPPVTRLCFRVSWRDTE
jgi:hypothetical protein